MQIASSDPQQALPQIRRSRQGGSRHHVERIAALVCKKRRSVAAQTQVGSSPALGDAHSPSRRERAEAARMAA
jgi:hypothetical protein